MNGQTSTLSSAVATVKAKKEALLARLKANPSSRLRFCRDCGLYKGCRSPFMKASMKKGQRVLIIGEAPGDTEDGLDEPFVGRAGDMLRYALAKHGKFKVTRLCLQCGSTTNPDDEEEECICGAPIVRESDVAFANVVACRPPGNDLKSHLYAIKACVDGVRREIQDLDPDIVVVAGNTPLQAILGLDKITTQRGRVLLSRDLRQLHSAGKFKFDDPRDDRIYFPVVHPSGVLRDPAHEKLFFADFEKLGKIARGEFKRASKPPPSVVITNFDRAVRLLKGLRTRPGVGYDYETTGLDPYAPGAKILCAAFAPLKWADGKIGRYQDRPASYYRTAQFPFQMPIAGYSIPLDHPDCPFTKQQVEILKQLIRDLLADINVAKMAQNHRFEYVWSSICLGQAPEGVLYDPMLMHFSTDETPGTHGLKHLVDTLTEYGDYEKPLEALLIKAGKDWEKIPYLAIVTALENAAAGKRAIKEKIGLGPYNGMDAYVLPLVAKVLWPIVHQEGQWEVVMDILQEATRLLGRIEVTGINVDEPRVLQLENEMTKKMERLEAEMRKDERIPLAEMHLGAIARGKLESEKYEGNAASARALLEKALQDYEAVKAVPENHKAPKGRRITPVETARREVTKAQKRCDRAAETAKRRLTTEVEKRKFNFGSDDHLRILFFEVMKVPVLEYTDTGNKSLSEEALEVYSRRYKLAKNLMEWRSARKLLTTYIHSLLGRGKRQRIIKPDGMIHPNVNPIGARTGRLSSGGKERGKSGESSASFKFNIQNLSHDGGIRSMFQTRYLCPVHKPKRSAGKGCPDCGRIIGMDYRQLEFMLMGIEAGEKRVLDCIATQGIVLEQVQQIAGWLGKPIQDEKHLAKLWAPDKARKAALKELSALAGTEIDEDMVWGSRKGCLFADNPDLLVTTELGQKYDAAMSLPEGCFTSWDPKRKAHIEETILKGYRADIHRISAAAAFNIQPEDVTEEQRKDIKSAVSFGLIYGRGAEALAEDMGWSLKKAKEFIDNFWRGYPALKRYLRKVQEFARTNKYVLSSLGRKRRVPEIASSDPGTKAHAINQVSNFNIQSVASDLNLLAAAYLESYFRKKGLKTRVIALVHDATYLDSPPEEVEIAMKLGLKVLEAIPLRYPFITAPLRAEAKASTTMG